MEGLEVEFEGDQRSGAGAQKAIQRSGRSLKVLQVLQGFGKCAPP